MERAHAPSHYVNDDTYRMQVATQEIPRNDS